MTAEEFVNKYYSLPDSEIHSVRIPSLIKCLERFENQSKQELLKEIIGEIENKKQIVETKDNIHVASEKEDFNRGLDKVLDLLTQKLKEQDNGK